jgi:molybdenum cofactor synthesis domain-containing protein
VTPTAAALIIGNEILTGKIADQNLVVLARQLRKIGVRLVCAHTVLDDLDTIAAELQALSARHDWVFTSGGVGPTHDDVTIEAVAAAFGRTVVVAPELDAMLRAAYGDRLTDGHLLMARIPEGARLVKSDDVPWPCVLCENVWVLPGVPEIFALKMSLVEREIGLGRAFVSKAVLSQLDEGHLKPLLDEVVSSHPDVDVGSYPRWGDAEWRTKITFDGNDGDRVEAARAAFVASLPSGSPTRDA